MIYRQGPTVPTTDDYADGVLRFEVNDGPQSTTNGSFGNNLNRASWSYEWSIATGLNGEATDLDDFVFKLMIDQDPGLGTDYRTLVLEPEVPITSDDGFNGNPGHISSDHQWRDEITNTVHPR